MDHLEIKRKGFEMGEEGKVQCIVLKVPVIIACIVTFALMCVPVQMIHRNLWVIFCIMCISGCLVS